MGRRRPVGGRHAANNVRKVLCLGVRGGRRGRVGGIFPTLGMAGAFGILRVGETCFDGGGFRVGGGVGVENGAVYGLEGALGILAGDEAAKGGGELGVGIALGKHFGTLEGAVATEKGAELVFRPGGRHTSYVQSGAVFSRVGLGSGGGLPHIQQRRAAGVGARLVQLLLRRAGGRGCSHHNRCHSRRRAARVLQRLVHCPHLPASAKEHSDVALAPFGWQIRYAHLHPRCLLRGPRLRSAPFPHHHSNLDSPDAPHFECMCS